MMIWEGWKGMNKVEKVMCVLAILCSTCIIIMAVLHFAGITEIPEYVSHILLGILMLLQTVSNWKKDRPVAVLSMCAAVIVFVAAVSMIFM